MRSKFVLFVFTLAFAGVIVGCGGSPTSPTSIDAPASISITTPAPTSPTTPGRVSATTMKWADLPVHVSPEVKDWLINNNINNYGIVGATDRWVDFPITVFPPPDMPTGDVQWGLDQWINSSDGVISFQIVSDPSLAKIAYSDSWEEPSATSTRDKDACGYATPRFSTTAPGTLLGGGIFFSPKPICAGSVSKKILWAHELGHHIFARGHFPGASILGIELGSVMDPLTIEALKIVYSLPPRTILVD